jgi:hypothetical protein
MNAIYYILIFLRKNINDKFEGGEADDVNIIQGKYK